MGEAYSIFTFDQSDHMMDNHERRHYRDALGHYPTGITIVTALADNGEKIGLTVNSFSSISLHPPLILFAVALRANSAPVFQRGVRFAVNILNAAQEDVARHFARFHPDKFATIAHWSGQGGVPIVEGCGAWLEACVQDVHPSGDHLLIVGRVDRFAHASDDRPLIYHRGRYRCFD
jgi:flavin reductase (DIM6/NTAB) family NADH-FMN oxidoreductase RutF